MSTADDRSVFPPTQWTLIVNLQAEGENEDLMRRSLEALCQRYWKPVYLYVCSLNRTPEDAQDIVQGFLLRVISKDGLRDVQADRGRFRFYLMAAIKHYLIDLWRHDQAIKRGGGCHHLVIGEEVFDIGPTTDLVTGETPETLYHRQWLHSLIDSVMVELRCDYVSRKQGEIFEALSDLVLRPPARGEYQAIARRLGATEAKLRQASFRLNKRFQERFREAVKATLTPDEDVDEEIRALLAYV